MRYLEPKISPQISRLLSAKLTISRHQKNHGGPVFFRVVIGRCLQGQVIEVIHQVFWNPRFNGDFFRFKRKGWDGRWVANRPSPNWQEIYTTYIYITYSPCRTWEVLFGAYHLLYVFLHLLVLPNQKNRRQPWCSNRIHGTNAIGSMGRTVYLPTNLP